MKGERIKYPSVQRLPDNAMSVSNYAKKRNVSVAYVYKLYKKGEVVIIEYQGYNFIIP
jgi:hypothetical protein